MTNWRLRFGMFRTMLAVCGVAAIVLPLQAAQHVPTAAEVVDLKEVGDPQISPEGDLVAYTVETPQPDGVPNRRRIWRVDAGGKGAATELPAADAASDRMPRWSPDGSELAFLSTRELPGKQDPSSSLARTQIWKIARDGGVPQPVTASQGEVISFSWSADGKRLAYLAVDPQSPERKARIARKDDAIEVGRDGQYTRLWVQDAAGGGSARAVTKPGLQVQDQEWAPDGRSFALRVSDEVGLGHQWYRSRVVLVSADDGRLLGTITERASSTSLQWSPDGSRLLYGELGPYGHTGTQVVYTLANQSRIVLGREWRGSLRQLQWRDDAALVGTGFFGVRPRLLEVDPANGRVRETIELYGPSRGFSLARDGRIAFVSGRTDSPPELAILSGGNVQWLTDTNPQVRDWPLGQVRDLVWRSSLDGREIHGVLVLPRQWRPGTRLPTLVQAHGGPAEAWSSGWLGSWHDWAQSLAMRGYAVLLPNPRGSTGQGNAFTELARNDWGPGPFQDVLDGLDKLEAEGITDPQRVAIGGWSYGGYLSAWAVGHSDRFRTAIVGAAVIDLGVMAMTTDIPYEYLPGYFGSVLDHREAYDRNSPIRYAADVKVPVLVLHGEDDKRVPISQGEQFYWALKFNDTPVEMVRYPRAPHWFEAREQERDVLERVLNWLDTHL